MRITRVTVCIGQLMVVLPVALSVAVARSEPVFDPSRVEWSSLSFKASKWLASAKAEVELSRPSRDQLEKELSRYSHADVIDACDSELISLNLKTSFNLPLVPRDRSETRLWFTSERGSALQVVRRREGGPKMLEKTSTFGREAVHSRKRKPNNEAEMKSPPSGWTNTSEASFSYPQDREDCVHISHPTAIFYLVSAARVSANDASLAVCMFSDKRFYNVRFEPEGSKPVELRYVDSSAGTESERGEQVEAIRVIVKARPVGGGSGDEFRFLGFEGDIEILMHPQLWVPVQVTGSIPNFGRVDFRLKKLSRGAALFAGE